MQFKYFLPLLLALSVSAIVCEFCIRYVLGYPDYGIDRFVYAISSSTIWQPIYKPYSRYLNNEVPGINVFSRNNLGLPGAEINPDNKRVFILGSSFIEAAQIEPHCMASSVCQSLLEQSYPEYSVYNLGRRAHDLYDSWFRYQYYKSIYNPSLIVLILDQRNSFDRHKQPLQFSLPPGFGSIDVNPLKVAGNYALSSSSLLALLYRGFRDSQSLADATAIQTEGRGEIEGLDSGAWDRMISSTKACLREFAKDASEKVIVVSIYKYSDMNRQIDAFCDSLGLTHISSDSVQTSQNQLRQMGHLNESGNAYLGNLIAKAIHNHLSDSIAR